MFAISVYAALTPRQHKIQAWPPSVDMLLYESFGKPHLRSYIAQHCCAHSTDVGSADGGGDVVISRGNICGEGAQGVERSLVAPVQLVSHVLGDFVERNMSRALVHHLQPARNENTSGVDYKT